MTTIIRNIKKTFKKLIREALKIVKEKNEDPNRYKGTAYYDDSTKDGFFTELNSFKGAEHALKGLAIVQKRYGAEEKRLVLQFCYGFVENWLQTGQRNLNAVFNKTFSGFYKELMTPEWKHAGISNLQNFSSKLDSIDLGDGVTILERNFDNLTSLLGCSKRELEGLINSWDWGTSANVLLARKKIPKSPSNFVLTDDGTFLPNVLTKLLGLRLLKQGDIRIGGGQSDHLMSYFRPAAFNFGLGGRASSRRPSRLIRDTTKYEFEKSDVPLLKKIFSLLSKFESKYKEMWGNVNLALAYFNSTYERVILRDKVLDMATAFEALLEDRYAGRGAWILADGDDERVCIFEKMKDFSTARNHIIHGNVLKEKDNNTAQDYKYYQEILRRLLVAFLELADSGKDKDGFYKNLDSNLLHSKQKKALRKSMGLCA